MDLKQREDDDDAMISRSNKIRKLHEQVTELQ